MKIQPRQAMLDVWRSLIKSSYIDGSWQWASGGRADSVVNAQQLMCLMTPVMEIESLRFSRPDETAADVLQALRGLGDAVELPRAVVKILTEFYELHSVDEIPLFNGGGHFTRMEGDRLHPEVEQLDIVESFALSVSLSLSVLTFAREFRSVVSREELINQTLRLERLASDRLTASMVGLLRSFTVFTFDNDSVPGQIMLETANQSRQPVNRAQDQLRSDLRDVTAGLRDLRLGSGDPGDLDAPSRLYEVGWSWGVIKGAPKIEFVKDAHSQRDGVALDAPYLYFTVVVLDMASDLFTERTRLLALLDEDQQRLAAALQLRWDLTQRYWSILASYSEGQWPIEDLPWRTTDGAAEDYFSLLVTSISLREMGIRNVPDRDVRRLGEVLRELGNRGRITRRPMKGDDHAIAVHADGLDTELSGIETTGSELLGWKMLDYAALLFKRVVDVTRKLQDSQLRNDMADLTDSIWDHLSARQMGGDTYRSLWDRPSSIFKSLVRDRPDPTWQITLRSVEALVYACDLASGEPLRSDTLITHAEELLTEAQQLYDQELLRGGARVAPSIQETLSQSNARLLRAAEIIDRRPGSAVAITLDILRDLDRLAAARQDRGWSE
ncbi:MAG TPA: SCO2524 family protein [Stackebrandtia sp.]|jgi:hypothetical protein|uniref:SCO2524 family protein n=1 Tax=Stackebrandtia sp. TaxID=2023065 RepID=UPI002D363EF4|nr:SCO2524 family protein [Stackebrandtia sp.]HZE39891.1 SCO2524 family protein [Stackebrandtia sp.]